MTFVTGREVREDVHKGVNGRQRVEVLAPEAGNQFPRDFCQGNQSFTKRLSERKRSYTPSPKDSFARGVVRPFSGSFVAWRGSQTSESLPYEEDSQIPEGLSQGGSLRGSNTN